VHTLLAKTKEACKASRQQKAKKRTRSWETTNLEREKKKGTNMFGTRK
jgi:hypothetical protein